MYVGKEGKGGLPVRMPRKRRKKKRPKRGRTLHVVQIVLLLAALFILTKYVSFVRVVVQDADPGGMKKGSLPERPYSNAVPIAIFAGRKDKSYITSLWKSIAQAVTFAEGSKRVCFILDDSGSRISKSYFSDYTRIACSEVVVVSSASIGGLENGADSSEKGMRLKEVWRAMLTKIWSSSFLSDYDGDVLFLEDDLVLAKDFLFALNFLLKVKNDHTESNEFAQDISLVALGGWGGENKIGAMPERFLVHTSEAVPTMAYCFNRSFWNSLSRDQLLSRSTADKTKPDWSESLSRYLFQAAARSPQLYPGFQNKVVTIASPSLSRVYHTGRRSSVGNVHNSISHKRPWGNNNKLLKRTGSTPFLSAGIFNYFGVPCTSPQGATRTSEARPLSTVLDQWFEGESLGVREIFATTKCFFRDNEKRMCDPLVGPNVHCRDEGSFLFPLGLRYAKLTLKQSVESWKRFGPAWSHMTEERMLFVQGK